MDLFTEKEYSNLFVTVVDCGTGFLWTPCDVIEKFSRIFKLGQLCSVNGLASLPADLEVNSTGTSPCYCLTLTPSPLEGGGGGVNLVSFPWSIFYIKKH